MPDWKILDLKKLKIPDSIILKKDVIEVESNVKTIQNVQVFYREALPPDDSMKNKVSVLLLHGKIFSSKTWLDLGSLQFFAAMGFHTVAVDLPGFANTPKSEIADRSEFLQHILDAFSLAHPVIVSPSMSGFFTLPYLVRSSQSMAGYVPVAPVGYEVLENLPSCGDKAVVKQIYKPLQEFLFDPVPNLSFIETPTMVVFGEKDRSRSSALLSLLPNSQCQEIPNGRHPAYLDNPELWHQIMYNFLSAVSKCHN